MKTTKTIEVEICDQCGTEVRYPPLPKCVNCGKEVCTHCQHYFSVGIREVTHRPVNIGYGDTLTQSVRYANEYDYHGVYCGPCSHAIRKTLETAGLAKEAAEPREDAVTLDSAGAM